MIQGSLAVNGGRIWEEREQYFISLNLTEDLKLQY